MVRLTPGRDFRLVWSASIVSQLGDWAARLALALLVLERGGGPATVGILGALYVLPWLGIGQVLTAWSTRFGRRGVLLACDTARGALFVVIATVDLAMPALFAVVAVAAAIDPVFEATKSAFVTELVSKDDYADAIQITHAANQAASLVGYAAGGVLVAVVNPQPTLFLNGTTFLLSALLIVAVSVPGQRETGGKAGPSLSRGLEFLRGDTLSALAFGATVIVATTAMSVESQVAVYGSRVAEFGDVGIGVLSAATPAATLIIVTMMRTDGTDTEVVRRGLTVALIGAGAGSILLLLGVAGPLAFVAFFLVGVIFTFVTLTNVVVGRRLPDENRVAIFSILQTGVFLGLSFGALAGGLLSEWTNPEVAAGSALGVGAVALLAVTAAIPVEA